MKNSRALYAVVLATLLAAFAQTAGSAWHDRTINGYVIDAPCAFTKNLKKPMSADCAVACANAGSQLVILADNGVVYWPISDAMPAQGQNSRLMEFAGKRVIVTGKVYDRAGSQAMVISNITVGR